MSNIEEDIQIVKRYLENSSYKEKDSNFFKNGGWEIVDLEIPQAMSNIIKEREQDKKRIKELEEENRIFKDSNVLVNRYFKLKDNSIPVQKVKDKIEELKKHYNTDNNIRIYTLKDSYELQATVLEELLEEDKQ